MVPSCISLHKTNYFLYFLQPSTRNTNLKKKESSYLYSVVYYYLICDSEHSSFTNILPFSALRILFSIFGTFIILYRF